MLQIMNAALISQGQYEIVSENEGSDEWRLLSRNWPFVVESALEEGNYHFTKEEVDLTTRTDGNFGYVDAYLVPQRALHVRNVWYEDANGNRFEAEWVQDSTRVHLTVPDSTLTVKADIAVSAEEHLWSATFTRGVKMMLEAIILRAIPEDHAAADRMEAAAEAALSRAKTKSSQSRSEKDVYRQGPIAGARFRRGSR